jgi:hypothetical protein
MIEYNKVFKSKSSFMYSEEIVSFQFVRDRLESHLHDLLDNKIYKIYEVNPKIFINPDRLDIMIKLGFLKSKITGQLNYDASLVEQYYLEHIRCFNFGKYYEFGSIKNSSDNFIDDFLLLFESIKECGFSVDRSIIPVNRLGVPINGAHRIACSIALDKPIRIVILDCESESYNVPFFSGRGLKSEAIRYALNFLIELNPSYRVGIIWPKGDILSKSEYISEYIFKSQSLSFNQITFLILLLYSNDEWVGRSIKEGSNDIFNKALSCFNQSSAHFFIKEYEADSAAILEKESLRSIARIDKHSIHICDTPDQSKDLVNIIFSNDALSTYNELKIDRFISFYKIASEIVLVNKLDWNEFIISGSSLIYLVGGRKNNDIDFYFIDEKSVACKKMASHNGHLTDFGIDLDLLHNSFSHLKIFNCSFFTLSLLQYIKSKRNEPKDQYDLQIIDGVLLSYKSRAIKYRVVVSYYANYFRVKVRSLIVLLLDKLYLKVFLKSLFRKR